MAIVAALGYSIYIIIGANVMKHVSPFQSSTVIFTSASVVYGMLTFSNGMHLPQTNFGWMVIAGIVIVSTIIPVTTFLAGLERIGPTNAAMLSTVEPIVTVSLATVLFGDQLELIVLVGGALILVAVVLLTRSEMRSIEI